MTTSNVREAVLNLVELGSFPGEGEADIKLVQQQERLYRSITRPVTDDEARLLVKLFGEDDYFGLASSLMHLIETAPNWPLSECLTERENEWVMMLRERAIKGGFSI